jgi:rhodanese-related sulfurtransferase
LIDAAGGLKPGAIAKMPSELENGKTLAELPEISREELINGLRDASVTLVDVLSAESFASGHIPGAINIPGENIPSEASKLLPDPLAEIVVYCGKFT